MNNFVPKLLRGTLLCMTLMLGACDGGLFGTGDGGPIIPVDAGAPPSTGGDPAASPTAPGSGVDVGPQNFENLDISTEETAALVNVLNYSSIDLVVRVDTSDVDSEVISANSNSVAIALAPETSSLSLVDSNDRVVAEFQPFTAASRSLSTIVVREDDNGINAIAARSTANTDDAAIANVRIIQVGSLGDRTLAASLSLQPTGTNPGPAEVILSDISFNTNAITDYVSAGSGDYILTDSLSRFEPVNINLEGGEVYSILLTGNTETGVIVISDSELTTRP